MNSATAFVVAIALGETVSGLFVGIGAFMVANADLGGLYRQRARIQIAVSSCVPASIIAGMLCGEHDAIALPVAVVVVMAGAFAAAAGGGATRASRADSRASLATVSSSNSLAARWTR